MGNTEDRFSRVAAQFKENIVIFCLKITLTFTNCVDPDEMQHYAKVLV